MQTIPDAMLRQIAQHRPDLQLMIDNLRACPEQAAQIEQALATRYLWGKTRLSATNTWHLAQCAHGAPWGGDWVTTTYAAHLSGYDAAYVRRLAGAKTIVGMKRGKTWYVRRDALPKRRQTSRRW